MSSSVTVRIRCEIEIAVGKWKGSSTFEQLTDQAKSEGVQAVQNLIRSNGGKIVGQPKVVFVTAVEDEQ